MLWMGCKKLFVPLSLPKINIYWTADGSFCRSSSIWTTPFSPYYIKSTTVMSAGTAIEDDHSGGSERLADDPSVVSGTDDTKASTARRAKGIESLWSQCSRWTVLALVVLVAAAAGTATYIYTSNNETAAFEARVSSRLINTTVMVMTGKKVHSHIHRSLSYSIVYHRSNPFPMKL